MFCTPIKHSSHPISVREIALLLLNLCVAAVGDDFPGVPDYCTLFHASFIVFFFYSVCCLFVDRGTRTWLCCNHPELCESLWANGVHCKAKFLEQSSANRFGSFLFGRFSFWLWGPLSKSKFSRLYTRCTFSWRTSWLRIWLKIKALFPLVSLLHSRCGVVT